MGKKEKIVWILLVLGIIALFAWALSQKDEAKNRGLVEENKKKEIVLNYLKDLKTKDKNVILEEEKKYPIQSRDHIKPGEKVKKYSTNPPTSGPHENAERGGFYPDGLLDEKGVHNLEHGYTWITYKNISDEDIEKIEKISKEFSGSVISSARIENDFDGIALASWGNLMKIKYFDKIIIEDFIKRNKNKSPEKLAR